MGEIEQWKGIYREAVQLCDAVKRLPEACPCSDARAHLEERCRCCGEAPRPGSRIAAETCQETLGRLRADVAILCEDFKLSAGALEQGLRGEPGAPVRRGILLAAADLQQVASELDHAGEAVLGFLHTCSIEQMQRLKRHAAALREHCERVNTALLQQ